MEDRIEHLEIKLSFQDDTVQALSDIVARQDREIELLKLEIKMLKEKFQEIRVSAVKPQEEETPPPHY